MRTEPTPFSAQLEQSVQLVAFRPAQGLPERLLPDSTSVWTCERSSPNPRPARRGTTTDRSSPGDKSVSRLGAGLTLSASRRRRG